MGLFVPKAKRRYVHALYAFMRAADDFADEPQYEGVRRERLDEWEARLQAAYEGQAEGAVFVALAETVRRLDDPEGPADATCSRRSGRTRSSRATRTGTSCSTTAGVRRTRSVG